MFQYKKMMMTGIAGCTTAFFASAAPIEVSVSEDFTIRRNNNGNIGTVEGNVHPKSSAGANADRYAMLVFNSSDFGSDVTSVSFEIEARDTTTVFAAGTWTFTLHGVNDGDPQDENISQATYNPDGAGTDSLFRDTNTLIDTAQVTTFGTFTATTNELVNFSDPDLLSFIQADTNGIVTLVITRNTESGSNTVFEDNSAKLTLEVVPEPTSLALMGFGSLLIARRRRR